LGRKYYSVDTILNSLNERFNNKAGYLFVKIYFCIKTALKTDKALLIVNLLKLKLKLKLKWLILIAN